MKPILLALSLLLASCGTRSAGSRNVQSTAGLDLIRSISEDTKNIVLPILQCERDGFVEDVSEYRTWAVKRKTPNGRIVATVPAAGTYYAAFVFYDGAGDERIGISIDGQEAGIAVADANDNRQKLFFLTEPRTFKGGEKIELRALGNDGMYRTEDLLLLRERPQPKPADYSITSIGARPIVEGDRATAEVTWITSWPAACTVETETGSITEELALNNHRTTLAKLEPRREYRYRIVGATREGKRIESEWKSFRTDPPAAAASASRKERVTLKVETSAARVDFPVTAGLPFPKGALGSERQLRLSDDTPLQTRVLQRWSDGSVKWVLLDFIPRQPAVSLEYGSEVTAKHFQSPLKTSEDKDAVTVDTGSLKFSVNKHRFGLVDSLSLNGDQLLTSQNPGGFYLTGPDGRVYTSLAAPDEVVIEERGPVRAVVRISGKHRSHDAKTLFAYTVRLHAWAGQPFLRVQHTFGNDNGAAEFTELKSLVLKIPLAGAGKQWLLAGASGAMPKDAVRLVQHTDDRFVVEPGSLPKGKRAPGWAEWTSDAHTVTLAVRDFWQNYPKDLAINTSGFELALCPPLGKDEYDSANGTIDEHRLYYYLHNGVYKLKQGVTKTHDIWLEFGKPATPAAIRQQQWARMAVAPAAWYEAAKVFGELSIPTSSAILKHYDRAFAESFAGFLRDREANREYGMLNFGDWWGERVINWGNSEYDTQHAFLLQFARTGDFQYFRTAEEVEWHNRDVDAIHYTTDKQQLGAVYAHAIGHNGDYYKERPKGGAPTAAGFKEGSPKSHFAADHTFIEGHFDYYFLTGDRRSLETAIRTADRYDSYFTKNYDFNNCRQPGWHLILTMAAYNATNDPYYLNAAKIVVERVLERQTPDGGWKRQMVPGHCYCTPRHQGNAGFMVGVLLTGMKSYYEATGDERVADSIVKAAGFLIDSMWVPESKGFHYTSCPRSNVGSSYNFRLFDGIVFAHQRTHTPKLLDVLMKGAEGPLEAMSATHITPKESAWGKGFTQQTRVTPHFIQYLVKLKELSAKGTAEAEQ